MVINDILLPDWVNDDSGDVAFELLSTITRLCVRAEYCQQAVTYGGLDLIINILKTFPKNAVS